jgi:hypothetical protein
MYPNSQTKTLDRGMGFIPTGVHHENMTGLEVVLADGDVVRTGQFAMTGSQTAHNTKLTFGPSIDGLFLQSNLGIVTKMGINLTPQPQAYVACSHNMPDLEDVEYIVDTFGALCRNGTIPYMCYCYSIIEWTAIFGKKRDWWAGDGPISDRRLKEIQKELDTGFWTCKFGLYGPLGVVEAQPAEVRRVTAGKPKGVLRSAAFHGGPRACRTRTGGMFVGVPSMWSLPLVDHYVLPGERRRPRRVLAHRPAGREDGGGVGQGGQGRVRESGVRPAARPFHGRAACGFCVHAVLRQDEQGAAGRDLKDLPRAVGRRGCEICVASRPLCEEIRLQ